MARQVLILANSRKLSGRCIAGKDHNGDWVRLTKGGHRPVPVSEAISCDVLKVVEVEGLRNTPSTEYNYHTENSVYNIARAVATFDRNALAQFLDRPDDIFGTGKLVPEVRAQELDSSLLFVHVQNLCIYIKDCGQYGYKLRGEFDYNGITYTDISVTDSSVESRLANARYPYSENYDEAYITVSLGEIFGGAAYKLIAGVVIP